MVIVPAPFPALGFDCITTMDPARASALKAAGMSFAVRYLGALTATEVSDILGAGLLLSVVTYGEGENWDPNSSGDPAGLGASAAQSDLVHLASIGIPVGATVWIDLEGVVTTATAAQVGAWVNGRAAVLKAAGWDVGLYVGANSVLNASQLYAIANVDRYWHSLSDVPTPACGFSLLQLYKTITLAETEIDVDCVQYDWQDRLPMMVGA
jgi:Domain of unknown function (DUF1906)